MSGRHCVIVDNNEDCVRGIIYRMLNLPVLPGPSKECGDEDNTEGEAVEEAGDDAAEEAAGSAAEASSA